MPIQVLKNTPVLKNRFRGCLLGLATGDAVGTTLEFKYPGTFEPISDMVGGGPFSLQPGQWTDDTSMALCLAESLLACDGMDLADQCDRYVSWWLKGENSVIGTCFDIGSTVCGALSDYRETGNPRSGPRDKYSAGNGSIMRLAPVPLSYYNHPLKELLARCEESSLTTHGASEALWACRILGLIIRQALTSENKNNILGLSELLHHEPVHAAPPSPNIQEIIAGSWSRREPPQIAGTGYVVKSLEAALWAFNKAEDFRHGTLLAANLGEDADTTAAIYGQIAGAFWGEEGIPSDWLAKLAWREKITNLADQLHRSASTESSTMIKTETLFRPLGARELELLEKSEFEKWPPRLPEQPIFYPVTNEEYAAQIARDWNTKDASNGNVGYVTEFKIDSDYLSRFEKQIVGVHQHEEYWIPSEQLDEFNEHIIGKIRVIRKFTPAGEAPVKL